MELADQIRQDETGEEPLLQRLVFPTRKQVLTEEDVFAREDPCNLIWTFKDITVTLCLLPFYAINYAFPLRYLTSWYRIFIIVDVILYVTDNWRDSMVSGATLILALYVPLASTVILIYAEELQKIVFRRYDERLYIYHHCIMHIVPSEILFAIIPLPHPPFLMSTAIVIAIYLVYGVILYLIWHETFLSNYFILDGPTQLSVLLLWSTCLLFSCAVMEFLFWNSDRILPDDTNTVPAFPSSFPLQRKELFF